MAVQPLTDIALKASQPCGCGKGGGASLRLLALYSTASEQLCCLSGESVLDAMGTTFEQPQSQLPKSTWSRNHPRHHTPGSRRVDQPPERGAVR